MEIDGHLTTPTGDHHPSFVLKSEDEDETEEYLEEERLDESFSNEIFPDEQNSIEKSGNLSEDESNDLYHCNACDVHFSSVSEHINEFHTEQVVILEVEDSQHSSTIINKPDKSTEIEAECEPNQEEKFETYEITEATSVILKNEKMCPICSKEFGTMKSLNVHIQTHETSFITPDKQYFCHSCGTLFQTQKSLKLHARMHKPIRQKTMEETVESNFSACQSDQVKEQFFCGICNKNYDLVFKDIHMETHSGKAKYVCTTCNKKFPDEELLVMHLNIHQEKTLTQNHTTTKGNASSYPCMHCGKVFLRPHEKVKHERVHTGEKPHKCEICGKCFRVSYCLTLHMRTHTDARPYVCIHCSKRFKAQSVYNHHLLTHSDARPYQCPFCPKSFKTSVQLAGHKNSHTKPFSCPECNRPFATLYAVKGHMESHKRPNHNLKHICTICGAVYARGFALKDHMKECHFNVQVQDNAGEEDAVGGDSEKIKEEDQEIQETATVLMDGGDGNVEMYSEIDQFATEEVITDWLK